MKVWLKNNKWYLLLFVIVFIILIPLGINIAFKQKISVKFLSAEWDANAALGFYAALLASLITVYGVFLSIQYAQKNYREDIKNRVLPYIAVTHYKSESKINLFELIQNEPVTEEKIIIRNIKLRGYFL